MYSSSMAYMLIYRRQKSCFRAFLGSLTRIAQPIIGQRIPETISGLVDSANAKLAADAAATRDQNVGSLLHDNTHCYRQQY